MEAEQRAKLIVREPGLEPVTVFLDRPEIVLGRGSGCDARLHSPYVSRRHAMISSAAGIHQLCALDASNGTSVNGRSLVDSVRLFHGDEIRLANVSLWYLIEIPLDEETPRLPERTAAQILRQSLLLSLDEETHRVWMEERDQEVVLAPNEFKLVQHLFARQGRVASREELCAAVWGEGAFDYESLYRLVQRVKDKIEPDPSNPKYVVSHRGLGYSLHARAADVTGGPPNQAPAE